jgi:hypothetical protein
MVRLKSDRPNRKGARTMRKLTLALAALIALTATASAQVYWVSPANQQSYRAHGVYGAYGNGFEYAYPYSTAHTAPPTGG